MKILTLFLLILYAPMANANPLLMFWHSKHAREIKFALETYGPATVKCYYSTTNGADFSLELFNKALESGMIAHCLQDKALPTILSPQPNCHLQMMRLISFKERSQ